MPRIRYSQETRQAVRLVLEEHFTLAVAAKQSEDMVFQILVIKQEIINMDEYYNEMKVLMSQVKPLVSNCEYQTMWVLPALNTDDLTEEEKAFCLQLPQTVKRGCL